MPQLRRPLASEHAAVLSAEIALVPNVADFAAMLRDNATYSANLKPLERCGPMVVTQTGWRRTASTKRRG